MLKADMILLFIIAALSLSTDAKRHNPSLWGLRMTASITNNNASHRHYFDLQQQNKQLYSIISIHGGASKIETDDDSDYDKTDSEDESSDVEEDEDEYDEETDDDSTDDYDDESEEEEEQGKKESSLQTSVQSKSKTKEGDLEVEYDEPLALSPIQDMGVTLGVMVLCNKLDLTDVKIIKYARYAFIAYVVAVQLFLIYVRFRAHSINDRTPITITNPLSNLLQNQMPQNGGSGDMVKSIANQFLASQSTIFEYDLSQAKSMNNSLLFPMIMLWFLHFKMGQVQPLFYQTATGLKDFLFSPLFQIYVLGRNLERPFRNKRMEELQKQALNDGESEESKDAKGATGEGDKVEGDEEIDDSDDTDEEDSDSGDDSTDEYDSDYDEYDEAD